MLRNIPNKVDLVSCYLSKRCKNYGANNPNQKLLKEIIDETSFGKYDFMYLRIGKSIPPLPSRWETLTLTAVDFANNCKFVHQPP